MSWIVDHTGRVSYKADWTSAIDIRRALEDTLSVREIKRQGRYKDFYRESLSVLASAWDRDRGRRPTTDGTEPESP